MEVHEVFLCKFLLISEILKWKHKQALEEKINLLKKVKGKNQTNSRRKTTQGLIMEIETINWGNSVNEILGIQAGTI